MISSTSLDSKERFFKCIFDLDDLEADVERDVEVVKSTNLLKRKRDADLHVDDEVVVITKQRSFAHETIKQKSEARALEVSELPRKVPRLTRSSTTLEGHKSDRVNQKILQRSQSDIIVKAPRVTGKLFDDLHFCKSNSIYKQTVRLMYNKSSFQIMIFILDVNSGSKRQQTMVRLGQRLGQKR